jgi:hypothetical protein
MDITADAYMYAGVRMMGGFFGWLLRHPLVVALLGAAAQFLAAIYIAGQLSERWERARETRERRAQKLRQRREFQHQTLRLFSERSARIVYRLSLIASRTTAFGATHVAAERVELVRELTELSGLDAECFLLFKNPEVFDQLRSLSTLLPTDEAEWSRENLERMAETVRGVRRRIPTLMGCEMRLLSAEEERSILANLQGTGRAQR